MNTKDKAAKEIFEFLESNKECLLLTGTHMFKKHELLVSILNTVPNKKILFRTNALKNLGTFLKADTQFKSGVPYSTINDIDYYFDSIDIKTWNRSPYNIDIAIVYPVSAILSKGLYIKVLKDLQERGAKKVFFVSCQETYNFSILDNYVDQKVIYDVEEEDVEYHNRVIEGKNRIKWSYDNE